MKVDHATGLCGGMVVASARETTRRRKTVEVRHPAASHEVAHELIVKAVDAKHDDAAAGRHVFRTASGSQAKNGQQNTNTGARDAPLSAIHGGHDRHKTTSNGRPSMYAGGSMPNS